MNRTARCFAKPKGFRVFEAVDFSRWRIALITFYRFNLSPNNTCMGFRNIGASHQPTLI